MTDRLVFKGAVIASVLAWAASAAPGVVVESWGGEGHFAHPRAVKIDAEGKGIAVDLSVLPAGAKVQRARLVCFRGPLDADEALVNVEIVPAGAKEPLELAAPWYDAFVVPAALVKPGQELAFQVRAFPGWIKEKTFLEIAYDPPAGAKGAQDLAAVKGVRAVHQAGQTFITWEEIEKVLQADRPAWRDVRSALENLDDKRSVRYRVYRSDSAITPENLHQAELLAEVKPLSGYNVNGRSADQAFHIMRKRMLEDVDYAKSVSQRGYDIPASAYDEVVIDRFVIPGGDRLAEGRGGGVALANGMGLYVNQPAVHVALDRPAATTKGWYAVTCVVNGRENTAVVKSGENLVGPIEETDGSGVPVFQRELDMKVLFDYAGKRLQCVQWTSPPLSNLPNQYYNWSVFIPEGVKYPAPVEVVFSGDDMFRRPRWPHRMDTILISPHDAPFRTWYYGYHDSVGTLRSLRQGTIQPYTWRRMLAFIPWAAGEFKGDAGCVTCSGDRGYSATAALHFGMRNPDAFSLVYTCKGMPDPSAIPVQAKLAGWHPKPSNTLVYDLQKVIGRKEWGLKTDTGENVWEFFDLTAEVAKDPKVLRPMLSYGGRGQWDWPPIAKFLEALAQARQPVISEGTWGAVNPPGLKNPGGGRPGLNVRRDRPIPVFTHCTGDYQGGTNGDGGATNYGLWWEDAGIVDEPDRFEITLTGGGTADVTPRRTSKFVTAPGSTVQYKTELLGSRQPREAQPQSGQAQADAAGLVTIPKVNIREKVRLIITRSAP